MTGVWTTGRGVAIRFYRAQMPGGEAIPLFEEFLWARTVFADPEPSFDVGHAC